MRRKLPTAPVGKPRGDQRWSTFLKNHAQAIIACDFRVVATVTFRILYVFVVMEHLSRRIIHANVTAHPSAAWTLQQLREAIPSDHAYRFIIHDREAGHRACERNEHVAQSSNAQGRFQGHAAARSHPPLFPGYGRLGLSQATLRLSMTIRSPMRI